VFDSVFDSPTGLSRRAYRDAVPADYDFQRRSPPAPEHARGTSRMPGWRAFGRAPKESAASRRLGGEKCCRAGTFAETRKNDHPYKETVRAFVRFSYRTRSTSSAIVTCPIGNMSGVIRTINLKRMKG
jgi:hypothetical protein